MKELETLVEESGKNMFVAKPKNGESLLDIERRIQEFIEFLKRKHKEDRIILVTPQEFYKSICL